MRKKKVITTLGFGGFMQLACRKVYFELCHWIISHYKVLYHRIVLGLNKSVTITIQDVNNFYECLLKTLTSILSTRDLCLTGSTVYEILREIW